MKIVVITLSVFFALSLASCGKKGPLDPPPQRFFPAMQVSLSVPDN